MFEYICERFLIYAANILGGGGVTATEQTVSNCMTIVNEGPNYRILIVYIKKGNVHVLGQWTTLL